MLSKGEPLSEFGGHSHWVWRAQYCPFYEALIASASSDTLVNLYHAPHAAAAAADGAAGDAGSDVGDGQAVAAKPVASAAHPSRCVCVCMCVSVCA